MILTVLAEKGGTGKTMVATNLAGMRAGRGRRFLLIDADRQGSSERWGGAPVCRQASPSGVRASLRHAAQTIPADPGVPVRRRGDRRGRRRQRGDGSCARRLRLCRHSGTSHRGRRVDDDAHGRPHSGSDVRQPGPCGLGAHQPCVRQSQVARRRGDATCP